MSDDDSAEHPVNILLVEDNDGDALLAQEALEDGIVRSIEAFGFTIVTLPRAAPA